MGWEVVKKNGEKITVKDRPTAVKEAGKIAVQTKQIVIIQPKK